MNTLVELVRSLDAYGTAPALLAIGASSTQTLSFSQLAERAQAVADDLRQRRVARGEPVAIAAPNSIAWVVTALGVIYAEAAPMPLPARLGTAERDALIERNRCRLFYAQTDGAEPSLALHVLRDAEPEHTQHDLALLLHTSGTTGTPKSVPLTHANVLSNIDAMGPILHLGTADRILLPLPLHHAYPLVVGLLLPLAFGASVVLPAGISGPELARALRVSGANWLVGVPRLYDAMVSAVDERARARGRTASRAFDALVAVSSMLARRGERTLGRTVFGRIRHAIAPRLRYLACGGAGIDAATERTLVALGYDVLVGYGLTETSPIVTFNRPRHTRVGSAGQSLPGVDVRIVRSGEGGIGEIQVRGPNVFAGYVEDPKATRAAFEDGWFRTGDLGNIDERGYLYLHGRATETLVLPGGEKLDPERVEAAYRHPAIDEVAVLLDRGKLVALVLPSRAAVDWHDARETESAVRAALAQCAANVQRHMRLTGFAIADAPLPRTELGKVRRHLLPALYQATRERSRSLVSAVAPSAAIETFADPRAQRVWNWLCGRFPNERLTPEMSPQLDLGIDSLGWIALTMELERAMGIALGEEALEHVTTLRDLVRIASAATSTTPISASASPWLAEPNAVARAVFEIGHRLTRAAIRLYFPLAVEGCEHLPIDGAYIVCPNHASLLDPPVLAAAMPWSALRRSYWTGSVHVMFSSPLRRLFSRIARVLPIDPVRGARSGIELCVAALREHHSLVWFPEGELTRDGTLQPFLPGIGSLALRGDVPIVPVYIDGTFAAFPAGRRIPRRRPLRVRFGAPIDPARWETAAQGPDAEETIASIVKAAVTMLR